MRKKIRVITLFLLLFFISIQFYQPAFNKGQVDNIDFEQSLQMSKDVKNIFQTSCYDCHSNNTNYAWYDYIQPARILVEKHIKDAKGDLNFSEWDTYSNRKKARLLESMRKQIETKAMPLSSYTFLHRKAKLKNSQIKTLTDWLNKQE